MLNSSADFTSTDFRKRLKKGVIPLSEMIQIKQEESYDPSIVVFTCSGPKMFFSNGFQWQIIRGRKPESPVEEELINQSKLIKDTRKKD